MQVGRRPLREYTCLITKHGSLPLGMDSTGSCTHQMPRLDCRMQRSGRQQRSCRSTASWRRRCARRRRRRCSPSSTAHMTTCPRSRCANCCACCPLLVGVACGQPDGDANAWLSKGLHMMPSPSNPVATRPPVRARGAPRQSEPVRLFGRQAAVDHLRSQSMHTLMPHRCAMRDCISGCPAAGTLAVTSGFWLSNFPCLGHPDAA